MIIIIQIQNLYQKDPTWAGELAISFIEYLITGQISSDDPIIASLVEGYKETVKKHQGRYDAKVAMTKESLRPIAEMLNSGLKQVEIAKRLGLQPPAVSKKVAKIESDFPELLNKKEKVSEIFGNNEKVSERNGNVSNISNVSNVSTKDNENNNDTENNKEDTPVASLKSG